MKPILHATGTVLAWPFLNLWRALRWIGRRDDSTYRKVRDVFIIFACLMVLYNTFNNAAILQQSRARGIENQEILKAIRAQTSPEAEAKQQRAINAILVTVDCNTRQAFQDAIRQLVNIGIPEASSITIVTQNCAGTPPR